MTVPKADPEAVDRRSLHERIAADLRDDIMSGELAPGASLPTTARLKERFEASSATVQKALQLLKDERLVVGRAGASVTVREHRQRTVRPAALMRPGSPGAPYRWLSEAAKHGTHARIQLLDVAEYGRPPTYAPPSNSRRTASRCSAARYSSSTTSPPNSWSPTTRWTSPGGHRWPSAAGSGAAPPRC